MPRNLFQKYYHKDLQKIYNKFDGVILDNIIGDIPDLQTYFEDLAKNIRPDTKVLISYHNDLWEPILTLASKLGLRKKVRIQNWLSTEDIANILNLSGLEVISNQKRFFGITTTTTARLKITDYKRSLACQSPGRLENKRQTAKINNLYSVSIVIPARNEEGNIPKIIPSIPKFGKWQEIIFVEGNSTDQTWAQIEKIIDYRLKKTDKRLRIKAFKQQGKGKADAVRLGLSKAKGDVLMIYDADRTVDAKDLKKFYDVLAKGVGEFANGSRLVYPMEDQAMQTLNKIANLLFGAIFSWILGQKFKDTLCGTKAFFRKDYLKFKHSTTDPFGDFDLIFGAVRNNLKVVEIPVRYKERVYGSTNINRFRHGLLLAKMAWLAFWEFRL